MSKARKASNKTTVRKGKPSRKPRAVALAVEEPRVSVQRKSRKMTRTSRPTQASLPTAAPGNAGAAMLQLMLQWSPWHVMLRQQAVLASMMSNMVRAKA